MSRSYAVSLGALAMGMVVLRGAIGGEPAGPVLIDALAAMAVFAAIGAIAGRVADQLVQKSLENQFRERVDRYRQDWIDAGRIRDESGHQALNE